MRLLASRLFSPREYWHLAALGLMIGLVWPWAPDRILHEHLPVNPRQMLRLIIILSMIQIAGHLVLRWWGPRLGLSLAGLVSGFVSSTATHAAMGAKARSVPLNSRAYVSAAVLSNMATAVQAMIMVRSIDAAAWTRFTPYLMAMALAAALCGIAAFARVQDQQATSDQSSFSIRQSLLFAALLTLISGVSAFVAHEWGQMAAWVAIGLSAVVDVHVAVTTLATLATQAERADSKVVLALLSCLTINAATKIVIAWVAAGYSRFASEVTLYLALIALAPWGVWWLLR